MLWAHQAVPLSLDGSPVTNVIRDLATEHRAAGGTTIALLSSNRPGDVPAAQVIRVDHQSVVPAGFFSRRELLSDHVNGLLRARRHYLGSLATPSVEALRQHDPAVIFVHEGFYALAGLPAWRAAFPQAKLLAYFHSSVSRAMRRRELQALLSHSDGVVTVSEHLAEQVRQRLGGGGPPIHAVLNGTRLTPATRRLREGPLRVLFAGQVHPRKGVHLLVEAMAHLQDLPIELTVVGSAHHGPDIPLSDYESQLRALAETSGACVTFVRHEPRDHLYARYHLTDLVCVPSVYDDPCPLVAVEALGAGCALAVHARGGLPEIAGSAARLIAPTAKAWAALLREAATDPAGFGAWRQACELRGEQLSCRLQYQRLATAVNY